MSFHSVLEKLGLFIVSFLVGMVLLTVATYLSKTQEHHKRKNHVFLISVSYILLLLITLRGVYSGFFMPGTPLWEMALTGLVAAWLSGIGALLYMFSFLRENEENKVEIKEIITKTVSNTAVADDSTVKKEVQTVQTEIKHE